MSTAELGASVPLNQTVFDSITPEQRERSGELAAAMAERFEVCTAAFSIVQDLDPDNAPCFIVAYAGSEGIDLGDRQSYHDDRRSWNEIRGKEADDGKFIIQVGDEKIDTRSGMTESVYRALAAQTSNRPGPLLDRPVVYADGNAVRFNHTWLTGDRAKPHYAPAGSVSGDGEVEVWLTGRPIGHSNFLFRPATQL